ncbi:DNA polymerase III subunit delta' [Helicobacter ailurogastricus]|uniref:DNA polymerase III delta prime subunit (HolB) n=1 Tax=Helicobacter ailurogastricus TaxID=1578720 RepID=A0A0K2Y141_9HELI|nr:DNA polymerase III subunit delta' [Helicobacter ailurogastricus]CRF41373.1 DNA polymerase III delta prime subunit (holB) [Helicobacter ailurogastricus]CRF42010.1 DNA polymerase III delta prime subunit (holB) [Helicobacter ailurogastricus]CRF43624.1 DNA polymerase III delta prime subunit (holB) [Helicobacter ailurogastricus]CRF52991.1 DNA poymerase III subunit delta' [Helicobacter ailurogastricus]BDQ28458.1 DNA polymerase III subunit delta' [Helicobacter ailurogastricus]
MTSQIIYANTPKEHAQNHKEFLEVHFKAQNTPFLAELVCEDELKIEHAHEIKRRCVLKFSGQKAFIIAASNFNLFAQNALLKILEEPPKNTFFILITKHPSALLLTIRSRLPHTNKRTKTPLPPFGLDLRTCDLRALYQFLQNADKQFNQEEVKTQIAALLEATKQAGIHLSPATLTQFDNAIHANALYLRPSYNLLPLLLSVLQARG